ncbi:MAG: dephospho-CoA kinase [Desulfohalobiaceae bacterium]|nr:dephospho-CoA kinase [Desulfohalobiaceae bacterium]
MTHREGYRHEAGTSGERLDRYWSAYLSGSGWSRTRIRKWIEGGKARVNEAVCRDPSYRVRQGDALALEAEEPAPGLSPDPGALDIRWRDSHLAVVNKPPGLSVHPGGGEQEPTLAHRLLHHFPWLRDEGDARPGIVHRLDKDTSGLMTVALSPEGRKAMARQLARRNVAKEYLALVHGRPDPESGEITVPVGRDPAKRHRMRASQAEGKEARSEYQVLRFFPDKEVSLVRVRIHTGRTHQIRVHMASIGHPLLGDRIYGPQAFAAFKRRFSQTSARFVSRQMLHSWRIGFIPVGSSQAVSLTQPLPKDFWRVLVHLEKRTQRVGITGVLGSGKSALTGLLSGDRVPRWDADESVARLYAPGEPGWEMLRRSFGERYVPHARSPVDKKRLLREMSESESIRREVQALIHPLVMGDLEDFFRSCRGYGMALAEVPLLLESGGREEGLFDVVVGVYCPDQLRRQRLREKRGMDPDTIRSMESWQASQEEKLRNADLVLTNPGDWQGLERAAAGLHSVLAGLRRRRLHRFLDWLRRSGCL